MKCPNCGADIKDGSNYCYVCQNKIVESKPDKLELNKKQCPKCFTINDSNMMFCSKCQSDLTNVPLLTKKINDKKKTKKVILIISIIVALLTLIIILVVSTNCNSTKHNEKSLNESHISLEYSLEKDFIIDDIKFKIDSRWKENNSISSNIFTFNLNHPVNLSIFKEEYDNKILSEDDLIKIHTKDEKDCQTGQIENLKIDDINCKQYSKQIIDKTDNNNNRYEEHLLVLCNNCVYDIYTYADFSYKNECSDLLNSIKNTLSIISAKPEETEKETVIETTKEKQVENETKADTIPLEYRNALKQAETYSKTLNLSKQAIYDQLTSEYGGKFDSDSAQYAIDNVTVNWKENALKSAESYSKTLNLSKQGIYDQLISKHGGKFTEEEAQYAIDNLNVNYKDNALKSAQSYQKNLNLSKNAIYDQLISKHGGKFTEEEAQYAIDNLE